MSALGHSRPSNSSPGRPFVRYAPDSDRRRGNAAKAAKCLADIAYPHETRCLRCHQKTARLLYSQQLDKPTPLFGRETNRY